MEIYERETQEVIKRFLDRRLSFPECIALPWMPRLPVSSQH
jgi:hypothetical protein